MPELKIASRIRICSGLGFHRGFGSGVLSSHPCPKHQINKNKSIGMEEIEMFDECRCRCRWVDLVHMGICCKEAMK